MQIQIGLPCNPLWLCQSLAWVLGLVVVLGLLGLVRSIYRAQRVDKKKRSR